MFEQVGQIDCDLNTKLVNDKTKEKNFKFDFQVNQIQNQTSSCQGVIYFMILCT